MKGRYVLLYEDYRSFQKLCQYFGIEVDAFDDVLMRVSVDERMFFAIRVERNFKTNIEPDTRWASGFMLPLMWVVNAAHAYYEDVDSLFNVKLKDADDSVTQAVQKLIDDGMPVYTGRLGKPSLTEEEMANFLEIVRNTNA